MTSKAFSLKQKMKKVIQNHLAKNIRRLKMFVGKKYSSVENFAGKKYSSVKTFVTKQFFRHFLPTKFLPIRYFAIMLSDNNFTMNQSTDSEPQQMNSEIFSIKISTLSSWSILPKKKPSKDISENNEACSAECPKGSICHLIVGRASSPKVSLMKR